MVIKKILPIPLLGFIALISIYATCNKPRLDCANTVYSFGLGISAYPNKDSVHIGDTIWLEITEPTTMKDAMSGSMINYSDAANLGTVIGFQAFSPLSGQFTINAANKFDFIVFKGRQVSSRDESLERQYIFSEENQRYIFEFAIIPKEIGIFRFLVSNAANVYRKGDQCTKASFAMYFQNTNQHYYLNPNFPGGPVAPGGDYYFKVY
jgi:hypothetical protein